MKHHYYLMLHEVTLTLSKIVLISVLSCQFSLSPIFLFSKHVLSTFSGSCDRITKLKSTVSALNYQLCYSSVFLMVSSSILVCKEFWTKYSLMAKNFAILWAQSRRKRRGGEKERNQEEREGVGQGCSYI